MKISYIINLKKHWWVFIFLCAPLLLSCAQMHKHSCCKKSLKGKSGYSKEYKKGCKGKGKHGQKEKKGCCKKKLEAEKPSCGCGKAGKDGKMGKAEESTDSI